MLLLAILLCIWITCLIMRYKTRSLKYLCTPIITLISMCIAIISLLYTSSTILTLFIIVGLAISTVADTFLMVEEVNLFHEGLIYFVLVHLVYISGLFPLYHFAIWQCAVLFCILIIDIILVYLLRSVKKEYLIPVLIYMIIISIMVFMSSGVNSMLFMFGAFLFMLSDCILAYDTFYKPIPHAPVLIWLLYAPAQLLIALSCWYK